MKDFPKAAVYLEAEDIDTFIDIESETHDFYEKKWPQLRHVKLEKLRRKNQRRSSQRRVSIHRASQVSDQ